MKRGSYISCLITSGILLFSPTIVFALAVGAVLVSSDDTFQGRDGTTTVLCGHVSDRWVPGTLDKTDRSYFVPYSAQIKTLKQKVRSLTGVKKERTLAKISTLKSRMSRGVDICRNGDGGGVNPTPKPTTTPSLGNFDSSGNVTSRGKSVFGIPSNLSANITQGRTLHMTKCAGCHGDYTNRTFSSYRSEVAKFPMSYTTSSLPDSELAHITAYLNRFRLQ